MAPRRALSVIIVAVAAAAAFLMLDAAQPWVGDWAAPVWLVGGAFVPFLIGLAAGARVGGVWQPLAGGVLGALVIAVPAVLFVIGPGEFGTRTFFLEWDGRDYGGRSALVVLGAGVVAAGGFGATTLPAGVAAAARLRQRKVAQ